MTESKKVKTAIYSDKVHDNNVNVDNIKKKQQQQQTDTTTTMRHHLSERRTPVI